MEDKQLWAFVSKSCDQAFHSFLFSSHSLVSLSLFGTFRLTLAYLIVSLVLLLCYLDSSTILTVLDFLITLCIIYMPNQVYLIYWYIKSMELVVISNTVYVYYMFTDIQKSMQRERYIQLNSFQSYERASAYM